MTLLSLNLQIKRFYILSIFVFIQFTGFAQSGNLNETLTIHDFKGKAKDLLKLVEKNNDISFSYTSKLELDFEVEFEEQELKLNKFLEILFKGKTINHKVSGKKIILYNDDDSVDIGNLKQTVRGIVLDEDSRLPLIGATVSIPGSDPIIGTATDLNGNFRLENISVGRVDLRISYLGYDDVNVTNIEVNSGKEVVLNLIMHASVTKIEEVKVTATRNKGEALNELSLLSARSISVEESKRFTGGMDDPARMVTSYAGVTQTADGSSDIIARGNSPKYMQWRLDGVEIVSPYHMDDQTASFGALTALNKSLLTTSDFHTGAFAPEYGNVLSNVMDVKLRNGNNEKFEATLGVGLMGTDLTIEGPFKKPARSADSGYGGSYLINYRYSTIALMQDIGLLDGVEGVVSYQDATFKLVLPTENLGTFSIFGLGGLSSIDFNNITPDGVQTPGRTTNAAIIKDYDKSANLSNLVVTNTLSLNKSSYLKTSISYSANGFSDDLYDKNVIKLYNSLGEYQSDSIGERTHVFDSRANNATYQGAITYNNRINPKNKIQVGTRFKYDISIYDQNIFMDYANGLVNVTDFNNSVSSLSNFVSWKHSLNDKITFVTGVHNTNVLLNKKFTLEPRLAVDFKLSTSSSFHAGYGKHSTTEKVHNYFAKVLQPDGSYTEPNKDLDLLKADHYVLGFEKRFSELMKAKVELYYQHLYDLPVEDLDTSYYATINEASNYRYVALVNEGVGKNYGVELTLERFFDNNYYFLVNASLFESKYKSLENVWRNSMYNGNYIVNILWGKEFKNIGKKQNKTLALNAKAFLGGGQRFIPLLRDSDGNVAVDVANNEYWDYEKAFDNDLVHIYNVNFSISYKINKAKSTHEIFVDLMNVINSDADLSEYYDESQPDNIGYYKQMIFLPNLMYRIYF